MVTCIHPWAERSTQLPLELGGGPLSSVLTGGASPFHNRDVKCSRNKRDGTPCQRAAGDDGLCAKHREIAGKQIKTGRYAKAVPGVPVEYHDQYQRFLAMDKPFDLRHEMATLRALQIELRDIVEQRRPAKLEVIARMITNGCDRLFTRTPEQEEGIRQVLHVVHTTALTVLRSELMVLFGSMPEIREMSDMLDKVGKMAERMKKIQEGVKLEVSIDTHILVTFLQQVVFKVVTEPERQAELVRLASLLSVAPASKEYAGLPARIGGELLGEADRLAAARRGGDLETPHPVAAGLGSSGRGFLHDVPLSGRHSTELLPHDVAPWD